MAKSQSASLERKKFFADPILVSMIVVLVVFLLLFIALINLADCNAHVVGEDSAANRIKFLFNLNAICSGDGAKGRFEYCKNTKRLRL